MRLVGSAVVLWTALSFATLTTTTTNAFDVKPPSRTNAPSVPYRPSPRSTTTCTRSFMGDTNDGNDEGDCGCPPAVADVDVDETPGWTIDVASSLRNARVTNARGDGIRLGDAMGEGRSVVVFLRHLGWPYCWESARRWCDATDDVRDRNATGPLFVSIGDAGRLRTFLRLNPHVPADRMYVDGYALDAYDGVGLGNLDLAGNPPDPAAAASGMRAPNMPDGWRGWWRYLTNVVELSPIPPPVASDDDDDDGSKRTTANGLPEGVKRLGGTFVVDGNRVLYSRRDPLPSVAPEPEEVLACLL